jgi:hypothetical protein
MRHVQIIALQQCNGIDKRLNQLVTIESMQEIRIDSKLAFRGLLAFLT